VDTFIDEPKDLISSSGGTVEENSATVDLDALLEILEEVDVQP